MRIGVLGTGMVGQVLAAKLAEAGHEVVVGTRDPAATLARQEPDGYGSPPFSAWHAQHPDVKVGSFADAATHGELVVNATAGGPPWRRCGSPVPATSTARCWSTWPTRSTSLRACRRRCRW